MTRLDLSRERSIHDLTIEDLVSAPLWDTVQPDVEGGIDVTVAPVIGSGAIDGSESLPWVHCTGHLADGTVVDAVANVFLDPPRLARPTLYLEGRWHDFALPPAPEFVLAKDGPAILANALGKSIEHVFPITLWSTPTLASTGQRIKTVFTELGSDVA
jgi:hypothetical protein